MKIKGHKKFVKMLKNMPKHTKQPVLDALEQGANEVVGMAKSLVPVDTGDLKDSFEIEHYQKTETASFGIEWRVTDFKGHFVEYGVRGGVKAVRVKPKKGNSYWKKVEIPYQAPRPFFWPAYRTLKARVKGRVTRAMKKTLQTNWKI